MLVWSMIDASTFKDVFKVGKVLRNAEDQAEKLFLWEEMKLLMSPLVSPAMFSSMSLVLRLMGSAGSQPEDGAEQSRADLGVAVQIASSLSDRSVSWLKDKFPQAGGGQMRHSGFMFMASKLSHRLQDGGCEGSLASETPAVFLFQLLEIVTVTLKCLLIINANCYL